MMGCEHGLYRMPLQLALLREHAIASSKFICTGCLSSWPSCASTPSHPRTLSTTGRDLISYETEGSDPAMCRLGAQGGWKHARQRPMPFQLPIVAPFLHRATLPPLPL